jgi:hypothetical protein
VSGIEECGRRRWVRSVEDRSVRLKSEAGGGAEHPMATRSSGRKAERHTANPKSVGAKAVVGGGEDRELW